MGPFWRALIASSLLTACGDDAFTVDAGADAGNPDSQTCLPRATYPLTISAGAFPPSPDHPSVLVYVPEGFDPTPPIDLVVYIHGFNNCVENIVRDTGQACTPG
ncbi:MAG TPA: hypothetical protein VIV40_42500, partial [Kofleriaceae bacterium]